MIFTPTFTSESPPYYALGLHALDGFVWTLPWVSTLHYGHALSPPDLIGTMAATIGMIEFIIGNQHV
jgi:hypothetical protein